MASTYLTRVVSTETNRKTMTFSFWCKPSRSTSGTAERMFSMGSSTNQFWIKFENDQLDIQSTNYALHLRTTRVFRDRSAWYHIVVAFDSTQATTSDRVKVYINGIQETSFSINTIPAQNYNFLWNTADTYDIGRFGSGNSEYYDGSMSHIHFIDGTAYDATAFGQFDANGVWTIKTDVSVTYGTNGFFILKDGNSVTDQSGNGNNWTVGGGTLTNTEDNPSNVFATINPLVPYSSNYDFYNGNTTVENDGNAADWTTRWGVSTLGMTAGKYYAEAKVAAIGTNQMYALGLVKDVGTFTPTSSVGTDGVGYYSNGGIYNLSSQTQTTATYTTNDIIGLAFDATNGTAQWYKNGSAVGITETGLSTDGTWFFVTNQYTNGKVYVNYGNGYFGTTAVASAGTNASGIGIFEYDVPTGYTALSTKGLNE